MYMLFLKFFIRDIIMKNFSQLKFKKRPFHVHSRMSEDHSAFNYLDVDNLVTTLVWLQSTEILF